MTSFSLMDSSVFPKELNVVINEKNIEVDVDNKKLTKEITKWLMDNQSQEPREKVLIKPKPRTRCTRIIYGGNSELRLQYLQNLLNKTGLFVSSTLRYNRRILMNMNFDVNEKTTQEELDQMKDFNIEIFNDYKCPEFLPKIEELKEATVTVGPCTAAFFLSTFGQTKDVKEMESSVTDDTRDPSVIELTMPVKIYASLSHNVKLNNYTFGFGNTEKVSAEQFKDMFVFVANNIKNSYCEKAKFVQAEPVDSIKTQKIAQKHGFLAACACDIDTYEEEVQDSFIYLFGRKDENTEKEMEETFNEIFEAHRLLLCKKCNMVYSIDTKTCWTYYHSGHRIPFPETGDMVDVADDEFDEDGNPIEFYNWSCCGEMEKGEPGCQKKANGDHIPKDNKGISTMEHVAGRQIYKLDF